MKMKMKLLNVLAIITLMVVSHCFRSSIKLSSRKSRSSKQVKEKNYTAEEMKKEGSSCIQPSFLSDELFDVMLSRLKHETPELIKKDYLKYSAEAGREMLSPKNAIRLFTEVEFGDSIEDVLALTREHLWLSSEDLKNIVLLIKDLTVRTKIVASLFRILIDHNHKQFEIITDLLDCKSKSTIKELEQVHPKPENCFFGDLSGNTVFVIDLSGSMMFTFEFEKERITRLLFLKKLFEGAINSLEPNQKIQIIPFSTNARYLFGGPKDLYAATKVNKDAFIQTVYNLKAGVGPFRFTNISEGLEFALKIEESYDRIIFFTDGLPTVGIRDPAALKQSVIDLNKAREKMGFKQVPINTSLLMLGKGESTEFRSGSKYYSKLVAEATKGTLKNYDTEAKK